MSGSSVPKLVQLNSKTYDLHLLGTPSALPRASLRKDATAQVTVRSTPLQLQNHVESSCTVVDGIQKEVVVDVQQYMPVVAAYVAAGAANNAGYPYVVYEQVHLYIPESLADTDELGPYRETFEHTVLSDPDIFNPDYTELHDLIGGLRADAENRVQAHLAHDGHLLLVDGSLLNTPSVYRPNSVGVVKTANTKYLPDEKVLLGLAPGQVSHGFEISSHSRHVVSCYMRLFAGPMWFSGLIRLEAADYETLERYAMTVYRLRQQSFSNDPRADRHLAPIRSLEKHLRTRAPAVFYG